jgi:DNA mismatch repair protein MutL
LCREKDLFKLIGAIKELSNDLINKIAAGEVIDSSHSVIKELIENSLDAGATKVEVHTKNGGLEEIILLDNGLGIPKDQIPLALKRHATSKIYNFNDLEKVLSFGFRGEALASIASISEFTIVTGTSEENPSVEFTLKGGDFVSEKFLPGRKGTSITVKNLFFNTPVRRKFLKSERSEDKKIKDKFIQIGLVHPDKEFLLKQNNQKIFHLTPENQRERIISLFGKNMESNLLDVKLDRGGIKAKGYISNPDFYRSNRSGQFLFINKRPVEIKYLSFLLKKCYDELLPHGAHPWCFLFVEIDPKYIDVNVHPTKKEIKFLDEEGFHSFLAEMVNSVLRSNTPVAFLEMKRKMSQPLFTTKSNDTQSLINESNQSILNELLYTAPALQKSYPVENIGHGTSIESLTENKNQIHREFIPKKHFGILFETFILAEADDGLYIIDQHTAHERIRYEEILNQFKNLKNTTQKLLTPLKLDFSNQEAEELLDNNKLFENIGLEFENLGSGSLIIRELPIFIDPGSEREIVLDFLQRIKQNKSNSDKENLYDLMAKSIACRSALKKGDQVSDHLISELLNRLSYCSNPSRCPHGRPTLIKFSKFDLEKLFYRR